MQAVLQIPVGNEIAVGKQHGVALALCNDGRGKEGHDVGAIRVVGDSAEPLGFALRAEITARSVESFEGHVLLGADAGHDLQGETLRDVVDEKVLPFDPEALMGKLLFVQGQLLENQLPAMQNQRSRWLGVGLAAYFHG
jgi:hypothetical protein